MFSIGQFSRITGLTVKTLRLYHDKGLLEPKLTDPQTGYRYYDSHNVEQARAIAYLKGMEFPLAEIREILENFEKGGEILSFLEKQRQSLESRLAQLNQAAHSLDAVIRTEKDIQNMIRNIDLEIREKEVEPMEIAGLRWKGKYADTGFAFQKLGKLAGRHIAGKAMNLYYDVEYKEGEADIESCFQVRKGTAESGKYSVRALPGGLCVSILHKGPYDQLHCAYAALFEYIQKKGYQSLTPFREIYLKGPGLIFKGNPAHYLTEIQVLVSDKKENIQ